MPAIPCHLSTDPEEKSAWLELVAAEITLSEVLQNTTGLTAEINGLGYFIDDMYGMLCGPMLLDGNINKQHSMHRDNLDELSADALRYLSWGICTWLRKNPDISSGILNPVIRFR